ncbi:MAG: integrase core domain-containing protein, partial [Chloroflexia bacterium]
IFAWEGIEKVLTPYRCPKANAFAERWVRTAREECLDQLLIISQDHLRRVLLEYLKYYNHRRPHQGINQQIPVPRLPLTQEQRIEKARLGRREVIGGIIHDYYWDNRQAASWLRDTGCVFAQYRLDKIHERASKREAYPPGVATNML